MKIKSHKKKEKVIQDQAQTTLKAPQSIENSPKLELVENNAPIPQNKERINLKEQYKIFKTMVKEGRVTSAILTARALNIDRKTLYNWKNKKEIRIELARQLTKYVSKVEESKNYQASLDLIELVVPKEKENNTAIQVNNYIDERVPTIEL